jgi:hypothetical protein
MVFRNHSASVKCNIIKGLYEYTPSGHLVAMSLASTETATSRVQIITSDSGNDTEKAREETPGRKVEIWDRLAGAGLNELPGPAEIVYWIGFLLSYPKYALTDPESAESGSQQFNCGTMAPRRIATGGGGTGAS